MAIKLTNGSNDVYVTFNATIEKLKAQINHLAEYWYVKDSKNKGDYEIHMNVDPVGQTNAQVSHFVSDLKVPFAGQDLTLAGNDPKKHAYTFTNTITDKDVTPDGKKLTESLYGTGKVTTNLRFVVTSTKDGNNAWTNKVKNPDFRYGQSGKTYFLVSEDGLTLKAFEYNVKDKKPAGTAGQDIMTLDGTKLTLLETDYAKDLLNVASHDDLAKSLLVNIGLSANLAACPIEILPEIIVPVKVIRPLDAEGLKDQAFTDAKTNGNILAIAALVKDGFSDWRDEWKVDPNFYDFYQIETVTADLENMTTNLNGADINKDKLKEIAPETWAYFWTGADAAGKVSVGKDKNKKDVYKDYGIIRYDNVNNTVNEFKVKIPLTVGYYWGEVKTDVTITVAKSTKN